MSKNTQFLHSFIDDIWGIDLNTFKNTQKLVAEIKSTDSKTERIYFARAIAIFAIAVNRDLRNFAHAHDGTDPALKALCTASIIGACAEMFSPQDA